MSVSPLSGTSSAQPFSTDKDNLLDVKEHMDFSTVDPHALLRALERLQSQNTRQITPRDVNAPIELPVILPGKLDVSATAQSKSAHGASTTRHDSPRIVADQQAVQQKKCCVIL